jgi:hypothetical protein
MKKFKTMLATIGILLLSLAPIISFTAVSFAVIDKSITTPTECGTRNGDWTANGCDLGTSALAAPTSSVNDVVKKVINIISWIVGVISVIMIIIAGLRYVTSGGQEKSVTGAKSTIMYAIIGLIVVALAQIIVRFVMSNVNS